MNGQTGTINIKGKDYQTVALRIKNFRDKFPLYSITTKIVSMDADCVVLQAQVIDEAGSIKATGHAEEYRTSSQINKTSALENCETSAIGRALAAFGFGGTEFASADEVVNAIHQQTAPAKGAELISKDQQYQLEDLIDDCGEGDKSFLGHYEVSSLAELPISKFDNALKELNRKLAKLGKPA